MRAVPPIGVMQGRLLPPIQGRIQCFPAERWREEFPRAKIAGLQLIEWIYEVFGADQNPLSCDEGIAELREISSKCDVAVRSLCADYFMDRPLLAHPEEGIDTLRWLIGRCANAGIRRVILPFVDTSRIPDEASASVVHRLLERVEADARSSQVELHLETDLAPAPFSALMAALPADIFYVNYDSGNSASKGYLVREEFAAYGSRIGSLHIKDRTLGGGSVPLGTGHADFTDLRSALDAVKYSGDVILQVARAPQGDELAYIRQVREQVVGLLCGST